ncbi:unnamed protein product, partial [Brassica rapa subsp. trilocularis]
SLQWRGYSLAQAVKFEAKNGTVIVCAVTIVCGKWMIMLLSLL